MLVKDFFNQLGLSTVANSRKNFNQAKEELPIARSVFFVMSGGKNISVHQLGEELTDQMLKRLEKYRPKKLSQFSVIEAAAFGEKVVQTVKACKAASPVTKDAPKVEAIAVKDCDLSLRSNRQRLQYAIEKLKTKIAEDSAELKRLQVIEQAHQDKDLQVANAKQALLAAEKAAADARAMIEAIENGTAFPEIKKDSTQKLHIPNSVPYLNTLYLTNQPIGSTLPEAMKVVVSTIMTKLFNHSHKSPKETKKKDASWVLLQNNVASAILSGFLLRENLPTEGKVGQSALSVAYHAAQNSNKEFGKLVLDYMDSIDLEVVEKSVEGEGFKIWDFLLEYAFLRPQKDILIQLPFGEDYKEKTLPILNRYGAVSETDNVFVPLPGQMVKIISDLNTADSHTRAVLQTVVEKYVKSAYYKLFGLK